MSNIKPIYKLEEVLSLPKGFYNNLLKEDDWSFVIKFHSLFEAAITHLLSKTLCIALSDYSEDYLNINKVEKNLSWLELSGKQIGKVSLASSFGLILDEQKNFIYSLSEIRNMLIHKISNVNFSFKDYTEKFDKNQRKKFIALHRFGINASAFISEENRDKFILLDPKLAIWLNGIFCLNEIYYCIESFNYRKEKKELVESFTEDYYKELLENIIVGKNS